MSKCRACPFSSAEKSQHFLGFIQSTPSGTRLDMFLTRDPVFRAIIQVSYKGGWLSQFASVWHSPELANVSGYLLSSFFPLVFEHQAWFPRVTSSSSSCKCIFLVPLSFSFFLLHFLLFPPTVFIKPFYFRQKHETPQFFFSFFSSQC